MKIPEPHTLVAIEHKGIERQVIVTAVVPEIGTMWRVYVHAVEDVFANGDPVHWLSEAGKRLPTFVRDLGRDGDEIFFALVAGESW